MSQHETSPRQLTFLLVDPPVRASASPGHDWGLPTSVTSGLRWLASSGQSARALSLWRTCLEATAAASLTQYEVIWKTKATPQHRFSFQLRYSVRPTNATAFSSSAFWPTASASDTMQRAPSPSPHLTRTGTLRHINRAGGQSQMMLSQIVRLWATPAAQDYKNAALPPSKATRATLPGDLLRGGVHGYLNPAWVELLMGVPPGWTALPLPPSPASPPVRARSSMIMSRPVWWRISRAITRRASVRSATRLSGSRCIHSRGRW